MATSIQSEHSKTHPPLRQESKLFEWLSAKRPKEFGDDLAKLLMEAMPREIFLNEKKRLSKSNFVREKMQKKIRQYQKEEIFNFYKTAKLINHFKWVLIDAGYEQSQIDNFAKWIMICLQSRVS